MKKAAWRAQSSLAVIIPLVFLLPVSSEKTSVRKLSDDVSHEFPRVQMSTSRHDGQANNTVTVDNGILRVTFKKPQGHITGIKYNGIDNVLMDIDEAAYWDVVWSEPPAKSGIDRLKGTKFSVITQTKKQVEISFSKKWNFSRWGLNVPLNADRRYIMRRGCSGVYAYTILERLRGWPDCNIFQTRIVVKLNPDKFHYMALSDERQRVMPSAEDRDSDHAVRLDYKEAVLLTNPTNPVLKGEVDDKYMYSTENQDNRVHGWISSDPPVGFWMITASDEFRAAGPIKQDLTSHVGPTTLNMFTATHYTGVDLKTAYTDGEPWKKVFGPVFLYLNSVPSKENSTHELCEPAKKNSTQKLWEDAKKQMAIEVESWPYNFTESEDFPSADQRGTVTGQLLVDDWYTSDRIMPALFAYVGLAAPGNVGSWQTDSKGYQFWTRADYNGSFTIKNVRPGNYSLYAWVPGFIGDYKYDTNITITPGFTIELGANIYKPPRNGSTLWEIGIPDRTAREFYIPDPYPTRQNRLYINKPNDKFRQYGLWERYTDLYPHNDLVYTIGKSNFTKDWFFAHVRRAVSHNKYNATTWRIKFDLKNYKTEGDYTLRLALAAATYAEIQVRINNASGDPKFSTGLIGRDNAIARHGIHGLYRLYNIDVPSKLLPRGHNTIYLTQSRRGAFYQGVMYDYIRLEGPPELD